MYIRKLQKKLKKEFFNGKIVMLLGARQVGKTTLVQKILDENFSKQEIITFNGDYFEDREILSQNSLKKLSLFVKDKKIIFIDEAQKIENIGNTLKILIDTYKQEKQIIITGSSSVNILNATSEPLTGRKKVFYMYMLSSSEIVATKGFQFFEKNLENFLIYGSYPEVVNHNTKDEKVQALRELADSSLYRDILEFQNIRNPNILRKLLKLLAFQVGNQVSYNELATTLGIDTKTVEKYIDLLEKSFVIFRLPPFFRNKRKELSKQNKIYFYDVGIRNSIIQNFNFLENRNDVGALWENFLIIERMKKNTYENIFANSYFWRNYNQQEIDYIEERDDTISAFEYKWKQQKAKIPPSFEADYPEANFEVISRENIFDFIAI